MLVTGWRRLAQGKRKASAWPEGSGFVAATLRMPRSKEALDFALDAIATVLAPGGMGTASSVRSARNTGKRSAAEPSELWRIACQPGRNQSR